MVVVLVLVVVVGGGGGGGVILGEVKARPKDIISFSLDYISKSKVQTSNPSSSPISLDTPARPADLSPSDAFEQMHASYLQQVDIFWDPTGCSTSLANMFDRQIVKLCICEKFWNLSKWSLQI